MYRARQRDDELSAEQRERLAAGRHEAVARELHSAGKPAAAGWVLEQIWDFEGALAAYLEAGQGLDSLRVALEVPDPTSFERALNIVKDAPDGERQAAIDMLKRRGRHLDIARLLESDSSSIDARALALRQGGDKLAAARTLADAGKVAQALSSLGPLKGPGQVPARALAARLAWELGDAEATARHAQAALRGGYSAADADDLERLLGRALASLGHDLAAQIAAHGLEPESARSQLHGRYHVHRTLPSTIAGAAYEGIDRVTLQEVEIHLLLADYQEGAIEESLHRALDAFARRALAADRLAHPAIRPIIRVDPDAGVLVLPHAEGPSLRTAIRAPGLAKQATRARALITFLVQGLDAAHRLGIVHGSLLPSQIVSDPAGRPLLGPFGADALAGLAATRTGSLTEMLTITAPECRRGEAATTASDIYSIGALFAALLCGDLKGKLESIAAPERALIDAALADDPSARPDTQTLLRMLRIPVADARDLQPQDLDTNEGAADPGQIVPTAGREIVTAAATWSEPLLDELASLDHPWIQPILDRDGPHFVLAAWPPSCHRLDADEEPANAPLGPSPALRAAITSRLHTDAWVLTPGGAKMLSLAAILPR